MLSALLLAAALQAAPAPTLSLTCTGILNQSESTTTHAFITSPNGPTFANATSSGRDVSQASVRLEVSGDQAKIQIPGQMIPGINSGGKNGWWNFDEFTADDTNYAGQFRINILNKPKIALDRRTGVLRMNSRYVTFEGACTRTPTEVLF